MTEPTTIYNRPAELLQNLIRFDTTNPPGNETVCISYIQDLCHSLGIETQIYSKDENRPNLIARIKGNGNASPLLLYGHVDVVSTANQDWTHPPFSAEIADGFIWGRGALDMKDGVAMMTSAFLKAKAENIDLPGDVILCILSDEEAGGHLGAKFLVDEHADLFEGVKYAIGEFGGFPMYIGGKKFFAIQTSEKGKCTIKVTFRGPAGHGSMPRRSPNNATAKLAKALEVLNTTRLPVRITPATEHMFNALADGIGGDTGKMFRQILDPEHTNAIVDELGETGRLFDAILHNTASPNIVRGGDKINVVPGQVELELDVRIVPGLDPQQVVKELDDLIGEWGELELSDCSASTGYLDMGLFDTLSEILLDGQTNASTFPFLVMGGTDGRHFSRLNIQSYGYLPMDLPEGFSFLQTVHAANERIPVEAVAFGTDKIFKVLHRFHD
jgi:acetylornithine deacetylase/succinyl-diaminopimelate desuccinylase-like protein